jgi:hypothetical protein
MVTIGVTGHRVLADLDKVTAGVDEALQTIGEAFPGQPLSVISSLAEGADRLVVRRALAHPRTRVIVPLPLAPADYMTDFQSQESRTEFTSLLERADEVVVMHPSPSRQQAYATAGAWVLDQCDVLIAIWDGEPSGGFGGAGDMVAQARRRGVPVAWIRAGNRSPNSVKPTTLGDEQGQVSFERFPDSPGLRRAWGESS